MKFEWLLPVHESKTRNEEIINHNAKYHFFWTNEEKDSCYRTYGTSLCGKYKMELDYYENVSSSAIAERPEIACKKCYERWKKEFHIEI